MLVFVLLLIEGLAWAWAKGVLTWASADCPCSQFSKFQYPESQCSELGEIAERQPITEACEAKRQWQLIRI